MENKSGLSTREKHKQTKAKVPFQLLFIRFIFKYFGTLFPAFAAKRAMQLFVTPKRRKEGESSPIFNRSVLMGTSYQKTRIRSYMWGYTGKIVLLVHGWESSSRIFEPFVLPLLKSGYRVVAMDGPAHANSSQNQTNLIDFGNAIEVLMRRLEKSGGVFAVVGHSFGGSSLMNMIYRKSKPNSLKKIVLIAVPSRIDNIFYDFFKYIQLPEKAAAEFDILMGNKFGFKIEDLKIINWVENLDLKEVLVIHDKDDKVISYKDADNLVDNWANAKLLLTEGLGHNRILKNTEVIEQIIHYFKKPEIVEQAESVFISHS